jgi:glutathione S-transferase
LRTLTAADARAIAEALAELHAARPVAPLAPAPASAEPAE